MKIIKLAVAAAIVAGTPAAALAAPTAGSAVVQADKGDTAKRPRWVTRRVCTVRVRHHHRERVCRTVRVRR